MSTSTSRLERNTVISGAAMDQIATPRKLRMTAVLALTWACEYSDSALLSSMFLPVSQTLGVSVTQMGTLEMYKMLVQAFLSPVAGALGDSFNRAHLIVAGAFIWGVFTCVLGGVSTYAAAGGLCALVGLGLALAAPSLASTVADIYCDEQRGRAFGIVFTIASFGAMATQYFAIAISAKQVGRLEGWRLAMLVVAGLGIVNGLLCIVFVREPRDMLRRRQAAAQQASHKGDVMDHTQSKRISQDSARQAEAASVVHVIAPLQDGNPQGVAHMAPAPDAAKPKARPCPSPIPPSRFAQHTQHAYSLSMSLDEVASQADSVGAGERRRSTAFTPMGMGAALNLDSRASVQSHLSAYDMVRTFSRASAPQGSAAGAERGGWFRRTFMNRERMQQAKAVVLQNLRELWLVAKVPTFLVLCVESIAGGVASSGGYRVAYFTLVGFSSVGVANLTLCLALGSAIGFSTGGFMADALARRFPIASRPGINIVTLGLAIPLTAVVYRLLPASASQPSSGIPDSADRFTAVYGVVGFLLALLITCPLANNHAMYAQVVPASRRSQIYALDKLVANLCAAAAAPMCGLIAERIYGYNYSSQALAALPSAQQPAFLKRNALALENSLLVLTLVPLGIKVLVYFALFWTLPGDFRRARAAQEAEDAAAGTGCSKNKTAPTETGAVNLAELQGGRSIGLRRAFSTADEHDQA